MNVIPLVVARLLIHDRLQNILFRVVFVDRCSLTTWLCRIDDDSWPFPMPTNQLIDEFDPVHGRYTVAPDDPWSSPLITSGSETATDKRHKHNYELIKPLIICDNERLILTSRERGKLIEARLKEVKSTRQTICALLLRYWKRGMTYTAVCPDYKMSGGPGKKRNPIDSKIGAPRIFTPGTGIGVNDEIRRMLQVGADYWLSKKKPTLQDALDLVVRIYFSNKITDGNKVIGFDVEPDKKPTVRQLQYYIKTEYRNSHISRKRDGEKWWNLQGRELLGMADGDVQGPGDCFQIDATVADVYLVSQFDRRRIVGRPIIYFVVDVYSRLIVGLYVGFEGPSWVGAMMALVNMVTPKVEYCKQYGIDIAANDWPSHYAPKRILADRGELMSVNLGENIVKHLNIDIENTSPGRADLKALVERRFGIVPAKFKQFTPGYVQQDFGERGAKDYRLDAALNLYEFTQLVIYAVCEHNFTPIRDKYLPTEMITDGLTALPLDLWEWGVINRSGSQKIYTVEEVALNVMPHETAWVTGKGISFKSGYYVCDTAIREEWFSTARKKGCSVDVSFDPRDLGTLYIRDDSLLNGFEKCRLLEDYLELQGKSLYETEEKENSKKIITAAGENERQAKRILFDYSMERIQKTAKKATYDVVDQNIPKSQRVADIRSNRLDEKEIQRGAETFNLGGMSESQVHLEPTVLTNKLEISPVPPRNALAQLKLNRQKREGGESDQAA